MAQLSIRVLGGLSVSKDGKTISSFESDKVRALFAYLAVEAGRPHRRETLAGLLWPDCPEQTAHHNLSQALFNLRKVLGDHTAKRRIGDISHRREDKEGFLQCLPKMHEDTLPMNQKNSSAIPPPQEQSS